MLRVVSMSRFMAMLSPPVALTRSEERVFELLSDQPVSAANIIAKLWPKHEYQSALNLVRVYMTRLRAKGIQVSKDSHMGYRLVG